MNTSLTCRDGVERLMDYSEGVLDDHARQGLDTHVAGCPRCLAFVRSYRETAGIVRAATRVTLTPGARASLRTALAGRQR